MWGVGWEVGLQTAWLSRVMFAFRLQETEDDSKEMVPRSDDSHPAESSARRRVLSEQERERSVFSISPWSKCKTAKFLNQPAPLEGEMLTTLARRRKKRTYLVPIRLIYEQVGRSELCIGHVRVLVHESHSCWAKYRGLSVTPRD